MLLAGVEVVWCALCSLLPSASSLGGEPRGAWQGQLQLWAPHLLMDRVNLLDTCWAGEGGAGGYKILWGTTAPRGTSAVRIFSPQNQLEVVMPPSGLQATLQGNSVLTTSAQSLSFLDQMGRWRPLQGIARVL